MAEHGVDVHRINICGGDARDWPDAEVNFRGKFSEWPAFFDRYLRECRITDVMVFGDCRPYHVSALGIAELRNVRVHVLEEGYLRPHWMTLEPEAVNARSTLSRDKNWFLREAARLPAEPPLPPITASFGRRARDSYWHYHSVVTGRLRFPHYRSHRARLRVDRQERCGCRRAADPRGYAGRLCGADDLFGRRRVGDPR